MAFVGELAAPLPFSIRARLDVLLGRLLGCAVLAASVAVAASLISWSNADPSFTHATSGQARNLLGPIGAIIADLVMQLLGLAGPFVLLPPTFWSLQLVANGKLDDVRARLAVAPVAVVLLACAASALPKFGTWPLPYNFGGFLGDQALRPLASLFQAINPVRGAAAVGFFCLAGGILLLMKSLGLSQRDLKRICPRPPRPGLGKKAGKTIARWWRQLGDVADRHMPMRREPVLDMPPDAPFHGFDPLPTPELPHRSARADASRPAPEARTDARVGRSAPEDTAERRQARALARRFAPGGDRADDHADPPTLGDTPHFIPEYADDPSRAGGDLVLRREADIAPDDPGPGWAERPAPSVEPPATAWRLRQPGGDELYGKAVAVVLTDRKATNVYLQRRLTIGYMLAADLIERMEQEGILGAPVHNGMRPILL